MVQLQPQSLSIECELPVGRSCAGDKCLAPDRPHPTQPQDLLTKALEGMFFLLSFSSKCVAITIDNHHEHYFNKHEIVKLGIQLCILLGPNRLA